MSREPGKPDNGKKAVDTLQEKLQGLPAAPGVYLHKNKQGKVIYVGKANKLNQRVRSYFRDNVEDEKTRTLVRKIHDVDYIVTESGNDALVLENQLIKEYRPVYNVRLKDDKQYPYIRISLQEPFPRVSVVRRITRDGARYFGPFTDVPEFCRRDLPGPDLPPGPSRENGGPTLPRLADRSLQRPLC